MLGFSGVKIEGDIEANVKKLILTKVMISREVEVQNVRNFPYPVRIRWSRQPNLVPFYLYNLNVRKISETMDFRTLVGPLGNSIIKSNFYGSDSQYQYHFSII